MEKSQQPLINNRKYNIWKLKWKGGWFSQNIMWFWFCCCFAFETTTKLQKLSLFIQWFFIHLSCIIYLATFLILIYLSLTKVEILNVYKKDWIDEWMNEWTKRRVFSSVLHFSTFFPPKQSHNCSFKSSSSCRQWSVHKTKKNEWKWKYTEKWIFECNLFKVVQ